MEKKQAQGVLSALSLPAWEQGMNSPGKVPSLLTPGSEETNFIPSTLETLHKQTLLGNPFLPLTFPQFTAFHTLTLPQFTAPKGPETPFFVSSFVLS